MKYIGNQPPNSSIGNIFTQLFDGDGTTTVFTLSNTVSSIAQTNVYISGVYQSKQTYAISNGTTLTFTTAPAVGTENIEVNVTEIIGITQIPTQTVTGSFIETDNVITTSHTIDTGKNAVSSGPITINTGATVTVPANSTWVIV